MAIKKYNGISFDTKTGKFKYSAMNDLDIQRQVNAELNPSYAANATALRNQLQQNKLDLLNQQQGVVNDYKTGLNTITENATQTANNVAESYLDRGALRSTFYNNAQGQVGADKVKAIASLGQQKAANIGTINNARAAATGDYTNNLLQLNAEKNANALARKNELKQGQQNTWLGLMQWNQATKKK